jgi:hypothetical protein
MKVSRLQPKLAGKKKFKSKFKIWHRKSNSIIAIFDDFYGKMALFSKEMNFLKLKNEFFNF